MSFFGKIFGSKKQSQQNVPGGYSGDKVNGKRQGHGTMRFEDGDTYSGEWHCDLMHGTGEYIFAKSGEKYIGEFKNGKISGQGRFYYRNGAVYEGRFNNGKRDFGTMTYANGDRYEGSWINEQKCGYGKFFYADGRSYCGMFCDGEMTDGFMTAKNENGEWTRVRCGTKADFSAEPIIMLVSYPENRKMQIIKEIREYTGCGLALAKDISENVPQLLKTSAAESEIRDALARFEPLGAEIEVHGADASKPERYTLTLISYPSDRTLGIIRVIKDAKRCSHAEAKTISESLPQPIITAETKQELAALEKEFERYGAVISII